MYFLEEEDPSLFEIFLIDDVPSPTFNDLNDPKEASCVALNTELFFDWWWSSSTGWCPTAPSWWGGGNFSLLLFPFVCGNTLHLCKTQWERVTLHTYCVSMCVCVHEYEWDEKKNVLTSKVAWFSALASGAGKARPVRSPRNLILLAPSTPLAFFARLFCLTNEEISYKWI